MRTMWKLSSLVFVAGLAACQGGREEGMETTPEMTEAAPAAGGALSTPGWMHVDEDARAVHLDIAAGSDASNNHWNFNGLYAGNGSITVPEGYAVTINFTNADPTQPHSLGIGESMASYPAIFESPQPVFAGAMSPDPTVGTMPNGSATITFTADRAGEFAMICYVPGHAVAGMHIPFNVSADGQAGVGR